VNDCRVGVPPVQVHVAGAVLLVVLVVDVVVAIVIGMVIGRVGTVGTGWAEAPAARRTTGRTLIIAMAMTILPCGVAVRNPAATRALVTPIGERERAHHVIPGELAASLARCAARQRYRLGVSTGRRPGAHRNGGSDQPESNLAADEHRVVRGSMPAGGALGKEGRSSQPSRGHG